MVTKAGLTVQESTKVWRHTGQVVKVPGSKLFCAEHWCGDHTTDQPPNTEFALLQPVAKAIFVVNLMHMLYYFKNCNLDNERIWR